MFMLHEDIDGNRCVYDFENKVKLEGNKGKISATLFNKHFIFEELDIKDVYFRPSSDMSSVHCWLSGMSIKEIIDNNLANL